MAPHTITPAVGAVCRCKVDRIEAFTTGSPHTNTIVITVEIESGFVAKDDLVPFKYSPVSSCAAPLQTEASMGSRQGQHTVMGAAIPNDLQPGAFVWFEKTQGLPVKVLPVPGWRPMKQLAVRGHFLRCGGLLDD
ncbi:e3 ubiquitin-protein ligase RNF13 [Trichonephila clavipes]|nr:e3 ubiquitin-protein ligase RNF13 [Trichonephila clavipes]